MKKILLIFLTVIIKGLSAQLPETDIFLCSVKKDSMKFTFTKPINITDHKGYDNQPCFTPDNKRIFYVSQNDSTQTDIYSYDIEAKVSVQFTDSKESEYSPSFTRDMKYISVVRVDADSGQRFYRLPLNAPSNAQLVKNSDSIGYACWLTESSLAMFILGPANTLQVLNLKNSERKLIASDIGRCMKLSHDGSKMYFVLKSNPSEWYIYSMDTKDYTLSRITQTIPKSEDFAIMPDGSLLMGSEGKLFTLENNSWKVIADFTSELSDFYRLTLSSDGKLLALVAFTGKKP